MPSKALNICCVILFQFFSCNQNGSAFGLLFYHGLATERWRNEGTERRYPYGLAIIALTLGPEMATLIGNVVARLLVADSVHSFGS